MIASNLDIEAIIKKIQYHVFSRRIRLNSFFEDYDGLRHYKVSKSVFLRILDSSTLTFLSPQEIELICQHYVDHTTSYICYKQFLEDIELVFRTPHLEACPEYNPPLPGEILSPRFGLNITNDEKRVESLLEKMKLLAKTRGIVFKYCYQPFDAIHHGVVSPTQFHRAFPFKCFSNQDIQLLIDKFSTDKNKVNYSLIHDVITINTYAVEPELPTSLLNVHNDSKLWEQQLIEPEKKLQAIIVMNRIRVSEFFLDYDKLRKGTVTRQQARSIFDSLLGIKILENDWNYLVNKYSDPNGMFKWRCLCTQLDQAFVTSNMEKDIELKSNLPDQSNTDAARRNRMILSEAAIESIHLLETDIKRYIWNARKHLLPIFQDFDKSNHGFVTKSQFARALAIGGFEVTNLQVEILAMKYCNIGTHIDFNYRDFLKTVDYSCDVKIDPTPLDITDSVYFDKKGKVVTCARFH